MNDVDAFLDAFFGSGNRLERRHASVADWIDTVVDGWPQFPLVLPRVRPGAPAGNVRWYVVSESARQSRRVRDELTAWVGPTFSAGWTGRPVVLNPTDPVDAAVQTFAGGPTLAFDVRDRERDAVRDRLRRLHALWMARPDRRDDVERRVGLLLREFDLALASGVPETAESTLRELQSRGLLTAENQLFLEFAILDARGQWRELAGHPRLGDIAAGARPWAVTRALITALYQTFLSPAETAAEIGPFVAQAMELEERYPELFRTRGALDRPEIAKAFALLDAGHPERPARTRARVLEASGLTVADRAFLQDVLARSEPEPSPARPVEAALALFERGEFDSAWDEAARADPSVERAVLLVQCAAEIATLATAQAAVEAFDALAPATRDSETNRSRRFARDLDDVRAMARPPEVDYIVPAQVEEPWTWKTWFDALHDRDAWPEAEDVARHLAEEAVAEPETDELVRAITRERPPAKQRVFVAALPSLLTWVERAQNAATAHPVRRAALEAICLQDLRGAAALDAALQLTDDLIAGGLSPDEYDATLELLEVLWANNAAPEAVGWLSELLELLSSNPSERGVLTETAARLVTAVMPYATRISRPAAEELARRAADAGAGEATAGLLDVATPAPIDEETVTRLRGKLVGCYTLTPGVAQRVKHTLEDLFPGLRVVLNDDHVRTDALEHLARNADVMIIMLRSAKHAATGAIERARPPVAPTLRLGCRGSTRVVEEFLKIAPSVQ
jgi:hypothetical protein